MAAKFFKQIFAPYIAPALASFIPGVGPLAAAGIGAAGGALKKSTEPGKQSAGQLFGSGAMGGLTGLGIGAGAQGLKGAATGSGFGKGIGSFLGSLNPFGPAPSAYAATGQGASPLMSRGISTAPGVSNFLNPTQLAQQSAQQSTAGGGLFGSIFNKKNALPLAGLGTMLGSQLIRSPQVPQVPQSIRDFQSQASQGTAIGNLGQQRLTEQLNQPFEEVSQAEEDAALRQLNLSKEDEMRQLQNLYRSARPGTDYINDSTYQRDLGRLNDRYATLQADTVSQLRRQVSQDFQNNRAQQILASQGIDAQRLSSMAQSGQIDLDMVMDQLALDYNDKQALRNYLLQFGGNVVMSQLNPETSIEDMLRRLGE